jgi:phage protein D
MPVLNPDGPLVPEFDVVINGTAMTADMQAYVVGVSVDDQVALPSMFTLEMAGSDEKGEEIPWIDDENLFSLGHVVEIKMGYADKLETLFKGEITGLEPEFAFDRLPGLTVRGYDRRHRLQLGRKTKTFVQQKDSDIASQVASGAGLTAQVTDSTVVHDYVVQANQTDMEFLQERARRIQFEVGIDDKTLFFRPVKNDASEVLTLKMEDDLLEFNPRLTSSSQISEVKVMGWSPKDKKSLMGQAGVGDESSTMGGQKSGAQLVQGAFGDVAGIIATRPVMTQAEADQMAHAHLNERVLTLISGDGVCKGRTDLRSGTVIKIEGVGKRFSGQYYVTGVVHQYSPQHSYQTHFTIRRNAS